MLTKQPLIEAIDQGLNPKYIFFWGHQQDKNKPVGKAFFSQWYSAPFVIDKIQYATAEHYMMAEKAHLFNDDLNLSKILNSSNPGEAKALGRHVQNFDEAIWQAHRFDICVRGNLAKFQQNPELGLFLKNTLQRVIVEASPVDKIWGIGLAEDHPDIAQPQKWPGLNLLGFALMQVRSLL